MNNRTIKVANKEIGPDQPTYFIADIAANHDGDLERAKNLIDMAAKSGANAVKFQHFRAPYIVSKRGFKELGSKIAHQAKWKSSVFEVYEKASLPWEWTAELSRTAKDNGVHFFTAPYDLEAIDYVDEYVPAYKIGSGDITWIEAITKMAKKGKPIFLATGASEINDVVRAVETLEKENANYCIMQCNTNYTGDSNNRKFANIRVISQFADLFPNAVLGLSDHTNDNFTTLTSIALGACAIEKHFTDNRNRTGPDHFFSLDPKGWQNMVNEAEFLKSVLGDGVKKIEQNESESVVVQRRALRYKRDIKKGAAIEHSDLIALRPCPTDGYPPYKINEVVGKTLLCDVQEDQLVENTHLLKQKL